MMGKNYSKNYLAMILIIVLPISANAQQNQETNNHVITQDNIIHYVKKESTKQTESLDIGINTLYNKSFIKNLKIDNNIRHNKSCNVIKNYIIRKYEIRGFNIQYKNIFNLHNIKRKKYFSRNQIYSDILKIKLQCITTGYNNCTIHKKIKLINKQFIEIKLLIDKKNISEIKKINFFGNTNVKSKILKSIIFSREKKLPNHYNNKINKIFFKENIELDTGNIEKYYHNHGYLNAKILSATPDVNKEGYTTINYIVQEGPKFIFGNTKIVGISIKDNIKKMLLQNIQCKKGEIAKDIKIKISIASIHQLLQEKIPGKYKITYDIERNSINNIIHIKICIKKINLQPIQLINITGNYRTTDTVIRKKLDFSSGKILSECKINKAKMNLDKLNFFDSIQVTKVNLYKNDKVNILFKIQEKKTGSLQFSTGFLSKGGIFKSIKFVEENFLGTGKTITTEITKNKQISEFKLKFIKPETLNNNLTLSFEIFNNTDKSNRHLIYEKIQGFNISSYYKITNQITYSILYKLQKTKVIQDNSFFVERHLTDTKENIIMQQLILNKMNNKFNPYTIEINQSIAGILGEKRFIKNEILFKYYQTIKNNIFFRFNGIFANIIGYGGKNIIVKDSFFNDNKLRGFESYGIGPRDKITKEALGGKTYYLLNSEVYTSIYQNNNIMIDYAIFIDIANLFHSDKNAFNIEKQRIILSNDSFIRMSIGNSIIFSSKIGTIRFNYGFPLRIKKGIDKIKQFSINLGKEF